jgi:hypothetical protein
MLKLAFWMLMAKSCQVIPLFSSEGQRSCGRFRRTYSAL